MSWLLLSLMSAFLLGFYDVSKKAAVHENAVLPVLFGSSLSGLLLLGSILAVSQVAPGLEAWGLSLQALTWKQHLLVLVKAGIVTTSWVLSFFALKHLPISLAVSIRASSPLFTVLGAILLFAEAPTPKQWLGMGIIFGCYLALSLVGRVEGIHFERNRWVLMLVGATLVGAMSGLYDKHLLQSVRLAPTTLQFWFTLYNVVIQGLLVRLLWWPRRDKITAFRWGWPMLAVGMLLVLADQLYFHALAVSGALVAVVSLLRRANVLVSFPLGGYLFGDAQLKTKGAIVSVMLLGVVMIVR